VRAHLLPSAENRWFESTQLYHELSSLLLVASSGHLQRKATGRIIALPSRFGIGLPQRAQAIGPAWRFQSLRSWLVDSTEGSIQKTVWNSWMKSGRG